MDVFSMVYYVLWTGRRESFSSRQSFTGEFIQLGVSLRPASHQERLSLSELGLIKVETSRHPKISESLFHPIIPASNSINGVNSVIQINLWCANFNRVDLEEYTFSYTEKISSLLKID